MYHSESITTKIILKANKYIYKGNYIAKDAVEHGAKVEATNSERSSYFEFAYWMSLILIGILILPTLLVSLISINVAPFYFNPISCILFVLIGAVGKIATIFYYKGMGKEFLLGYSSLREYPISFSKRDLWGAIFVGGLLGLGLVCLFYGLGIFLHLNPRGLGG